MADHNKKHTQGSLVITAFYTPYCIYKDIGVDLLPVAGDTGLCGSREVAGSRGGWV